MGLPHFERAGDPSLQYSNASLAALNCSYAELWHNLSPTLYYLASGIQWCRRGRSMTSVNWMYPSNGRSGNGSLVFAFESHDIASTREKLQEINVMHAGPASFSTFLENRISPTNYGHALRLYYLSQAS